jgi:hypothetical protein
MCLQFQARIVDACVRLPVTCESKMPLTRFFHFPSAHDKNVAAPCFVIMDDVDL